MGFGDGVWVSAQVPALQAWFSVRECWAGVLPRWAWCRAGEELVMVLSPKKGPVLVSQSELLEEAVRQ